MAIRSRRISAMKPPITPIIIERGISFKTDAGIVKSRSFRTVPEDNICFLLLLPSFLVLSCLSIRFVWFYHNPLNRRANLFAGRVLFSSEFTIFFAVQVVLYSYV